MGYTRCPVMPCLYYLFNDENNNFMHIIIHVDDGVMVSNKTELLDEFMAEFLKHVKKAELLHEFKSILELMLLLFLIVFIYC